MRSITLVTGNTGKLHEYEALLPKNADILFKTHKLDLAEIQSLELEEIVRDKLQKAYDILKSPVMVEDVSAGLESLGGLPGPFFKFFEQKMGKSALFILSKIPGEPVIILCTVGYYNGKSMIFGQGELRGIVVEPRGENGFGFDSVVIPEGKTLTMAEMSYKEKNAISHRAKAVKTLLSQLNTADELN